MNRSESIAKIAKALSVAQGQMTGAKKASANPFFKSKYSDLASVMQAIAEPFASNGLSFSQSPGFDGERITVTTLIMHESGEWIEGTTILPPGKNDAQGFGSSISYGKRYGLQSMVGCPSIDDDGNEAVQKAAPVKQAETKEPKGQQKEQAQEYVMQIKTSIIADDGLSLRQLNDELKDDEDLMRYVWKQFTTAQRSKAKALLHEVKDK